MPQVRRPMKIETVGHGRKLQAYASNIGKVRAQAECVLAKTRLAN